MEKRFDNAPLHGSVRAIASKSHAHRLLLAAALADGPTRLRCATTNADIDATCRCLSALGASVGREGEWLSVVPLNKETLRHGALLDCGESGSTLRFLLPVVLALAADAQLFGRGRLPDRPLSPLYEELILHGARLSEKGSNPLLCGGTLAPGSYTLDGGVSSQFVSGLLFALPLLGAPSQITVTGKAESRPYIDLTLAALRTFGVSVEEPEANRFALPAASYRSPGKAETEGDWSNAAFWLTAGAFSPAGVTVTGLNPASLQGDKAIVPLLRAFGAFVEVTETKITVRRTAPLQGIRLDGSNIPDLVPILSVLAAGVEGDTVITGCERLRLKESDRIAAILAMLRGLGGAAEEREGVLTIHGTGTLSGGAVDSHNDHRIAMSAAIAAAVCQSPVLVRGMEAADKSYPGFCDDWRTLQNGTFHNEEEPA